MNVIELHASAAETVTGNGSGVNGHAAEEAVIELDVTAAATDANDTLDVTVQIKAPDGTNWIDVCAFTQVAGTGGAKRHIAKLSRSQAQAMFEDAALAAGNVRHLLGGQWRAKWTIADPTGSNASFTFAVHVGLE